jgi:hypothetical protein
MSGIFVSQIVFEVMSPFEGDEPPPSTTGVGTFQFDGGEGSDWYIVGQIVDSGNELRSKVVKSAHATGRLTNPKILIYGYDVQSVVNTQDLEDGTNSTTGAIPLPDSAGVAQSPRVNVDVPNAVLHTIRLQGDDTGNDERDEVHEIVYEVAEQGVRR